jgi:hypothetical protein
MYSEMKKCDNYLISKLCLNPVFSALFIIFFEEQLLRETHEEFDKIKIYLKSVNDIKTDFLDSIEEARKSNQSFFSIQEFNINENHSKISNVDDNGDDKPLVEKLLDYIRERTPSKINKLSYVSNENINPNKIIGEVKEESISTPIKDVLNVLSKSKDYSVNEIDQSDEKNQEPENYNEIIFESRMKLTPTPCNSVKKLDPNNFSLHDFYKVKEDKQIDDFFKYSGK